MKKQTLRLFSMVVIAVFSITIANAQITSYSDGGSWISDTTWIGGVVPGASDNVVINGPVYVRGNNSCLDITINYGNTLQNYSGYHTLQVNGTITNNGVIHDPDYGVLTINSAGDLINNGIWANGNTNMNGISEQHISFTENSEFAGENFSDTNADSVIADTDLSFYNTILTLTHLHLPGGLNLKSYGATIMSSVIDGNIIAYGITEIDGNVACEQNFTVEDTLQNYTFATLQVNGTITNNGVIQDPDYGVLSINSAGDFVSNGKWTNTNTKMNGTSLQHISFLSNSEFRGENFSDTYADSIVAITDIAFHNTVLTLSHLHLPGELNLKSYGATIRSSVIDGNIIAYNKTIIDNDVVCEQNFTVEDTLQDVYPGSTLQINGTIANNGLIKDSQALTINSAGDFVSNGKWTNTNTNMNGTSLQHISFTENSEFRGTNFTDTNADSIIATTDLAFYNTNLTVTHLYLPGELNLKSYGATIHNSTINGNIIAYGITEIDGNVVCEHNFTVEDTLQNYNFATLQVNGTITNNGVIQDPDYGVLTINSAGDFVSNGKWTNTHTKMNGTSEQHISFLSNSEFRGENFSDTNADSIVATTDIAFYNTELYVKYIHLPGGLNLKSYGATIRSSVIDGNIIAYNKTIIDNDVVCEQNFTVEDTLQDVYPGSTLQINGTITNNGLITDITNLTINSAGDFVSNGKWTNTNTKMNGTYLQHISFTENSEFRGTNFTDTNADSIIATTDLAFYNTNLTVTHLHLPGELNLKSYGATIHNSTINGNIIAYGITEIDGSNVVCEQNFTVEDTLQGVYPGGTLQINGTITNNGLIKDGHTLTVNSAGDFVSNGKWTNTNTNMNGTSLQYISFTENSEFTGTNFSDINADSIVATTDIAFNNTVLTLTHFHLPEEFSIKSYGATIKQSVIDGNIIAYGITNINYDAVCEQNFTVEDTLQGVFPGGTLQINGTITNNGLIKDGHTLTVNSAGDFVSNGKWANTNTNMNGTSLQYISFTENSEFTGTNFSDINADSIVATTDIEFHNTVLALTHIHFPEEFSLKSYGSTIKQSVIDGNVIARGITNISYTVVCEQNFTVEDTLQGSYPGGTLQINGTTTNNGLIRNGHTLTLNSAGDIINKGTWENQRTYLNGTTDQNITLINDQPITGEVRFDGNFGSSPYQWYYNDAVLDSSDFTGETSQVLTWEVPVSSSWYGTFYCQTGVGNSRNIIVGAGDFRLDVTAYLEGPYNGSGMNNGLLYNIPVNQPYYVYPWEYDGDEMVDGVSENAVDWILVEIRDAANVNSANSATSLGGQAAFIMDDGSIVDLDGESLLSFDYTINQNLFVVLWHRNHLPVVSNFALSQTGGVYTYDFTNSDNQAYGSNQSDLGGNKFGMIAGDLNADGTINEFDLSEQWNINVGNTGYFMGDGNMDTQVNNNDKNDVWFGNYSKYEILPE